MSGATNVLETPLAKVRDQIARACAEARRDPATVMLVAISKTFGADAIEPVIAAGQRVFGENRVQEAKAKWPPLKQHHSGIELHLVGSLQSNKAKEAVALFDAIHSVDRPSLAEALSKEIARQGRTPTLFVEIDHNTRPRVAGRGSAVFMHVARPNRSPTAGCVALAANNLRRLLAALGPKTRIAIQY